MSDSGASPPFTLSREAHSIRRSMMRDLIAITARPGIISFAGGLPAPELFPLSQWRACTDAVLSRDGRRALQYGPPFLPLQEAIAALMTTRGAPVVPDQVFIVTGAQQGLHVAGRLLMDDDSVAIVDRFIFSGVRQAFSGDMRELREIENGASGELDEVGLRRALSGPQHPRAIVVVPDFHNPLGTSVNAADRRTILHLAASHGTAVVEDDPYALLAFSGEPSRPMVAEDPDRVIYIGSFSKIVAPGLRLGWMVVPRSVIAKLRVIKESVDLETSALTQRVTAEFLTSGALDHHLNVLRNAYRTRRDAMLEALAKRLPPGSRWTAPEGGMFLWVELPDGYDTLAMLEAAVAAGVAYVPGTAFASGPAPTTMRLNFSNATVEQIETGVAQLGAVLRDHAALAA